MDQWWASQIEMPLSQKTNSPCGWSDVGGHPVSKEQFSGQESRYHLALVVVVVTEGGMCGTCTNGVQREQEVTQTLAMGHKALDYHP